MPRPSHDRPIAIIGAGNVGRALGTAFLRVGEDIVFGARDVATTQEALRSGAPALAGVPVLTVGDATSLASTVVLAAPYSAALEIAAAIQWDGRILVDVTNPVNLPDHSGLILGTTVSGAEEIAARAGSARVVKAFNSLFPEVLGDADFGPEKPFAPICGDDRAAVDTVLSLATRIGLDAVNAGPLRSARYIEPFTMLSVAMLFAGEPRGFAFSRLRR